MKRLLCLLIPFLLVSCIFNEDDGTPRADKLEHPDIILENAVYQLAQENSNPIILKGRKIIFYGSEHRAELDSFSFSQKGDDGKERLSGHADKGLVNTESETIELEGNVMIAEIDEGFEISAEKAYIDSRNQEITASGPVVVKSRDGSFIGKDFCGDMKTKKYSFKSIEKGELEI